MYNGKDVLIFHVVVMDYKGISVRTRKKNYLDLTEQQILENRDIFFIPENRDTVGDYRG